MTNSKTFKKILLTFIIALAFLIGQNAYLFSLLAKNASVTSSSNNIYAAQEYIDEGFFANKNDLLEDNDFNSAGGSSYPLSSSYWKLDKKESNIYTGIIDLKDGAMGTSQTNYENCGLNKNKMPNPPATNPDNYNAEQKVLMINSKDASVSKGFVSSDGISLSANSFYSIEFNVYTDETAFASIYLYGNDMNDEDGEFTSIQTKNGWRSYTYWITTTNVSNQKLDVALYLGSKDMGIGNPAEKSKGLVLFDNIKITKHSQLHFNKHANNNEYNKKITIGDILTTKTDTQDGFVTADFSKWTVNSDKNSFIKIVDDVKNYVDNSGELKGIAPGDNYQAIKKAIAVSATNGFSSIKSPDIQLKRNTIYRFSFWAKGDIKSGDILAKIDIDDKTSTDISKPNYKTASFTSLKSYADSSNDEGAYTNYWTEYSFYITSNPLSDTVANIYFGLGKSAESTAKGYAFFSNVTTQVLSSSQKDKASTIGQAQSVEVYPSSDIKFDNGYFNFFESDNNIATPDKPKNWKHEQDNLNASTIHGIVNIDTNNFKDYKLGNGVVAPEPGIKHNVLLMKNETPCYQLYSNESSQTLSAIGDESGYYEFSIDIQTQNINKNSGVFVYLKDPNSNIITGFKANSDLEWTNYKIYIKNYYNALDITPYIYLGTKSQPTTGLAFIDNCVITTITKDNYTEATISDNVFKIDLNCDSFDLYEKTENNIYTPNLWKGILDPTSDAKSDENMGGIINTNNIKDTPIPFNPSLDKNQNLLFIHSDLDSYYYFESNLPYKLTANDYYKFTVKVKTINISQRAENISGDPCGASIILNGLENAKFTGINTAKNTKLNNTNLQNLFNDENNKFVEYTLYFKPTKDTDVKIQLGLGEQDSLTSGYAFFDDLTMQKITEDEYKNLTSQYQEKNNYPNNIKSIVDVETPKEETESFNPNNFDWFAIPTVIIAIAVIIALIGFLIKKFANKRVTTTNVTTNYDRLDTLLKDVDRRNKSSTINQKLRDLNDELKISEKFLKEEIEAKEKEQAEYNTAKEIANDNGISVDEPKQELLDHEQTINQLNENIKQIKEDIEILELEKTKIKLQEEKDIEKAKQNKVIKKRK